MTKFLAIDDNKDNLISLEAIIKDAFPGSTMFTALDGPKGIDLAIAIDPDVILLDIVMPDMDGFEVCRRLKQDERVRYIPVVFLTALKSSKESRIKALETGAEAFLSKPIDEIELTAQIRAMIKIKSANIQKLNEKEHLARLVAERTRELEESRTSMLNLLDDAVEAKNALQESELKYRNQANFLNVVTENSPFAMWVSDAKGVMIRANQALRNILNLTNDMIIGKYNVLHDENLTAQGFMPAVEAVFKDLKISRFTMFWGGSKAGDVDLSNANELWIDVSMFPIQDDAGKLVNVVCQYVDITERKQAEEALKVSEEKHRKYVEHAPLGIFVVDSKGKYVDVNPGACELLGYTRDELLQLSISDIANMKKGGKHFQQLKKDGIVSYERGLKRKDESVVTIKLDAVALPNNQYMAFCTDITEGKKAETELNRQKDLFELVINSVPSSIFWKDLNSVYLGCNTYFAKEAGMKTPEEVIGSADDVMVWGEDADKYRADDKLVMSTGKSRFNYEEAFLDLEGNKVWWETNKLPLRNGDGKIIGVLATAHNVTRKKVAQNALQKSEEKFKALYDKSPAAIYETDANGKCLMVNAKWCKYSGMTNEEAKGDGWQQALYSEDREQIFKLWNKHSKSNKAWNFEYRFCTPDNKITWVHGTTNVIKNPKGDITGYIGVNVDITERKQAEEELNLNRLLLRNVLDIVPAFICAKNLDGKFILVNKKLTDFYGSTVEAMTNVLHADICEDENELHAMLADDREVIESGKPKFIAEETMENPDGSIIVIETNKIPFTALGEAAVLIASNDITKRKQAEEKEKKHHSNIELLSQTAMQFVEFPQDSNIYDFVGEQLSEFVGKDSYIIVNSVDSKTGFSTIHSVLGAGKLAKIITNKLGRDPVGMVIEAEDPNVHHQDGRLHIYHEGLYGLLYKTVPESICKSIEKLAGVTQIYVIDLAKHDQFFGNIIIFSKNKTGKLKNKQLIETFIKQASIAILKKKAEEALIDSDLQIAAIFKNSPIPIALTRAKDNQLIDVNKAWLDLTGFNKDDVIGIPPQDLNVAVNSDTQEKIFAEIQAHGRVNGYDTQLRKKNGEIAALLFSAELVELESEKIIISMAQDITERKQTEEAIKNQVNTWQTTFNAMSDSVSIIDLDGNISQYNAATLSLFNINEEDIKEKKCFELVHGTKDFFPDCPLVRMKDSSQPESMIFKEKELWLEVNVDPIFNSKNELTGAVHVVSNITARKQAEKEHEKLQDQLRQAQKMESVGRLAGGVAHDYNNISSIILGYSELALDQVEKTDPLYDDLMEILTAVKRSTDITQQLLAFARKQTVAPKVLDLNDTIGNLLKMLRRLIGEDIDLAWIPGAEIRAIKIDPSQINQIMANLCVNARDAIANVGRVSVETKNINLDENYCADYAGSVPGEYIQLSVSDDGCGMTPETRDNIFEPFFTTKGIGMGTGLGLSTVYGIVKQNNGFINVYSEINKGTTFRIYLPIHAGETFKEQSATTIELPLSRGETVLLVEDNESILKIVKKILEKLGYVVLSASIPMEATKLAAEHADEINLLITDVVMPEMNGRELSDRLQSLYPNLKTLFMSGYTADIIAHRGVLEDGFSFIAKPFSNEDLAVKVREVLDEVKG